MYLIIFNLTCVFSATECLRELSRPSERLSGLLRVTKPVHVEVGLEPKFYVYQYLLKYGCYNIGEGGQWKTGGWCFLYVFFI